MSLSWDTQYHQQEKWSTMCSPCVSVTSIQRGIELYQKAYHQYVFRGYSGSVELMLDAEIPSASSDAAGRCRCIRKKRYHKQTRACMRNQDA
jgi:hypothetical protein